MMKIINLDRLKRPFPLDELSFRVGATTKAKDKGIALAYLTARAVMDRLDDVCGNEWQCRYPNKGLCEIGIFIGGEWIWRANGADETDFEGVKGQYSDAFKRAAVMWGIGRYLYNLPNEWVPIKSAGKSYKLVQNPTLPNWAQPGYVPKMNTQQKREYVEAMSLALEECDELAVKQLADELDSEQKLYVWREFNSAQRGTIKDFIK